MGLSVYWLMGQQNAKAVLFYRNC